VLRRGAIFMLFRNGDVAWRRFAACLDQRVQAVRHACQPTVARKFFVTATQFLTLSTTPLLSVPIRRGIVRRVANHANDDTSQQSWPIVDGTPVDSAILAVTNPRRLPSFGFGQSCGESSNRESARSGDSAAVWPSLHGQLISSSLGETIRQATP